ncbi:MAG TPA: hypothetical protein VG604_00575 [Candidatus Saccharimonadales bacterium]|nr:hypothetical protein [Candidatus Saccharimonadales bacterium]
MKKSRKPGSKPKKLVAGLVVVILLIAVAGLHHHGIKGKHSIQTFSVSDPTSNYDVYSSWKNSCDPSSKLCFKYPTGWIIGTAKSKDSLVTTVLNSTKTVNAQYGTLATSVGPPKSLYTSSPLSTSPPPAQVTISIDGPVNFYCDSITAPVSGSTFKVIGGYYATPKENIPAYLLVEAATADTLGLAEGKITPIKNTSVEITDGNLANRFVLFGAGPITNNPFTPAQAKAWLGSPDGKTAQQIAQSFYAE